MPVSRELPAGIASRRAEATAVVVKKTSGLNVARFIAREDNLYQARKYASANEATANRSRWEEKQNLRTGSGARTQQHKQYVWYRGNTLAVFVSLMQPMRFDVNVCRLEEELKLMNKEVQIVRHERLKKYYERCYEEWDQELRARGLAIVRDRD